MSRSGYREDCEYLALYRGTVERIIGGRKGQAFLRELAAALDAMPVKELIAEELINAQGQCCTLGAVAVARSLDVQRLDYEDPPSVGKALGIAWQLAAEIAYENDEALRRRESPPERWVRMRQWVGENIREGA